jgi:hypothetical protein
MKHTYFKLTRIGLSVAVLAVLPGVAAPFNCRAEQQLFPEVTIRITNTPTPTPIPFPSGYSASDYPEELLEFMDKYPEASDFVLNYPTKKNSYHTIDLTDEITEGEIPLFLQWDERWGYQNYGDGLLGMTGCGPTCLAMVKCGLTGDDEWNPAVVAAMADQNGFYVDGVGSSWNLMTTGAQMLGLTVQSISYNEDSILDQLKAGMPVICSVKPGDFTYSGHFIVLSAINEDGTIQVRDPNSPDNSDKGWDMDVLFPQIKNLWSYSQE